MMKCGYKGCDWAIKIPGDQIVMSYTMGQNEYPIGYIAHVLHVHEKIPPVIWEWDKEGEF
jgi:hypothetical protein